MERLVLQQAENDIWNVRLDKEENGVCCQVRIFLKPTWSESLDRGGKNTAQIPGRKGSTEEVERDWASWEYVEKEREGHKVDGSHEYKAAEMWENFTAAIVCHSPCRFVITISPHQVFHFHLK